MKSYYKCPTGWTQKIIDIHNGYCYNQWVDPNWHLNYPPPESTDYHFKYGPKFNKYPNNDNKLFFALLTSEFTAFGNSSLVSSLLLSRLHLVDGFGIDNDNCDNNNIINNIKNIFIFIIFINIYIYYNFIDILHNYSCYSCNS